MKIRQGFVSNSSSSSFVVAKAALTEEQIELIKNHWDIAAEDPTLDHIGTRNSFDAWEIKEGRFLIKGFTSMDNFDMEEYLKVIGVDLDEVEWPH